MNKKLICLDLVMLAAVIALMLVNPGKFSDVLTGSIAAIFVISFYNHIRHYLLYKKFY